MQQNYVEFAMYEALRSYSRSRVLRSSCAPRLSDVKERIEWYNRLLKRNFGILKKAAASPWICKKGLLTEEMLGLDLASCSLNKNAQGLLRAPWAPSQSCIRMRRDS